MKIYINNIKNNYKCFMLLPNINIWYDEGISVFFGWLCWGFNIEKEEEDGRHDA